VIRPGDTVVDVGTGTGVLAFLAHRAGAGRVIGLERSDMVEYARVLKRTNCPKADVTFEQRDVLVDALPRVKADVVVCELLGNFGIEENMVTVLKKVRRLLKPGGRLVPGNLELMICPVQCAKAYQAISEWQKPQYGLDFSPLQELAYNAVYHVTHEPLRKLSSEASLVHIDFLTVDSHPPPKTVEFELTRKGTLHGFAGWFRSELAPGQVLDTGPGKPDTHWGQVFFPLGEPLAVERGGRVRFRFEEQYTGDETRWCWSGSVRARAGRVKPRRFRLSASRYFDDEYAE
jgi:SAM-dependent methyltransferase